MTAALSNPFREQFFQLSAKPEFAGAFRDAAGTGRLEAWTTALTAHVVRTCGGLGWRSSAKGHKLDLLPISRSEYLSLDVCAFSSQERTWEFPVAVFELENATAPDKAAYSLWKLLCVSAGFRILFCYRNSRAEASEIIQHLKSEVVGSMQIEHRAALVGETIVVVGCRDAINEFPYGYFLWWRLNSNTGTFEII